MCEWRRRHPIVFWLGLALGLAGANLPSVAFRVMPAGGSFLVLESPMVADWDLSLTWGQQAAMTWLWPLGAVVSLAGLVVLVIGWAGGGLPTWQRAVVGTLTVLSALCAVPVLLMGLAGGLLQLARLL